MLLEDKDHYMGNALCGKVDNMTIVMALEGGEVVIHHSPQ